MNYNEQPQPELESIQEDKNKKEKDLAREQNIKNGYSDDMYEKNIIRPVTNRTLH